VEYDQKQETVWCFSGLCSCRLGFRTEEDRCGKLKIKYVNIPGCDASLLTKGLQCKRSIDKIFNSVISMHC
jgi:hypothetical protein